MSDAQEGLHGIDAHGDTCPCARAETTTKQIETAFKEFTSREDIAIVLISQNVANLIRLAVDAHEKASEG